MSQSLFHQGYKEDEEEDVMNKLTIIYKLEV
jgi:hypothetical protein